jgi:hypothetical protein
MLESFVSTQKMGVQKALQKKFKQFISYKRDFVELLMATLQVCPLSLQLKSICSLFDQLLNTNLEGLEKIQTKSFSPLMSAESTCRASAFSTFMYSPWIKHEPKSYTRLSRRPFQ